MKKVLIFGSVFCLSCLACYAQAKRPKLTPEQIAERKYRHFGGYLYQPQQTKVISIINDQKLVDAAFLAKVAEEMRTLMRVPVSVGATKDVAVTLKVCECDKLGPLVILPESATACVSVKKLSSDAPSKEVLESRVNKELWRGLIYALGGGNTFVPLCVMKQVSSLAELDAIPTRVACPDAFDRAMIGASHLGIKPERRVSYRQACREGWAPAPTNDVQKAIWDQLHQLPTKPIKIKPETKK